jgi:tetratricopeptide (TPR) repeat protein
MKASPLFLSYLLLLMANAINLSAAEKMETKDPSPDGRFALGLVRSGEATLSLVFVERATGKVLTKVGEEKLEWESSYAVWSADSQRVAVRLATGRNDDLAVHFRDGRSFKEIKLPPDMPRPQLRARVQPDGTAVSEGFVTVKALHWQKSGELLVTMEAENDTNESYKITVKVGFDKKQNAHVAETLAPASHYLLVGDNLVIDGKYDEAVKSFDRALAMDPKNTEARVHRGDAKAAQGNLDAAIADFEHALKAASPDQSYVLLALAHTKETKGLFDQAIWDYSQLIKIDKDFTDFDLQYRGSAFALKKQWKEALADFRSSVELESTGAQHGAVLAWLARVQLGDKEGADRELAIRLSGQKPGDAGFHTRLAEYVLGKASEQELLETVEREQAKADLHGQAWFYIGVDHSLAGEKDRAAEAFEKCLAADKALPRSFWRAPESWLARPELAALKKQP